MGGFDCFGRGVGIVNPMIFLGFAVPVALCPGLSRNTGKRLPQERQEETMHVFGFPSSFSLAPRNPFSPWSTSHLFLIVTQHTATRKLRRHSVCATRRKEKSPVLT